MNTPRYEDQVRTLYDLIDQAEFEAAAALFDENAWYIRKEPWDTLSMNGRVAISTYYMRDRRVLTGKHTDVTFSATGDCLLAQGSFHGTGPNSERLARTFRDLLLFNDAIKIIGRVSIVEDIPES